jgi:hypothetical protein
MAEQGLNNISMNAMKTLVGVSPSTNLRDLCNHANINKYSFYRPRPIQLNPTTKKVEWAPAPTTNRKLGDFRRYNHTALTPGLLSSTGAATYQAGDTYTSTIGCPVKLERLNIQELTASDPLYLRMTYYHSAANRTAQTGGFGSKTDTVLGDILVDGETPPPGHTNNQTKKPVTSIVVFQDTTFSTSNLTGGTQTKYGDMRIVDSGDNDIIRFDSGNFDITFTEQIDPYVQKTGWNTPAPPGFTTVFPVVTTSNSSYLAVEHSQASGNTTTGSWYWYLVGLSGSTWYRIGNVAVQMSLRINNPGPSGTTQSETVIFDSTLPSASASSNLFSGNPTLDGGDTWGLNDVGVLYNTGGAIDWTGFTIGSPWTYALPGYPA